MGRSFSFSLLAGRVGGCCHTHTHHTHTHTHHTHTHMDTCRHASFHPSVHSMHPLGCVYECRQADNTYIHTYIHNTKRNKRHLLAKLVQRERTDRQRPNFAFLPLISSPTHTETDKQADRRKCVCVCVCVCFVSISYLHVQCNGMHMKYIALYTYAYVPSFPGAMDCLAMAMLPSLCLYIYLSLIAHPPNK